MSRSYRWETVRSNYFRARRRQPQARAHGSLQSCRACERMPLFLLYSDSRLLVSTSRCVYCVWISVFFVVLSPTLLLQIRVFSLFFSPFTLTALILLIIAVDPSTRLSLPTSHTRLARHAHFESQPPLSSCCADRKSIYNPSDQSSIFFSTQLSVNRVGMWARDLVEKNSINFHSYVC